MAPYFCASTRNNSPILADSSSAQSPAELTPGLRLGFWFEWDIPHQKNDQEGKGHAVPIRGNAAAALQRLIEVLRSQGITEGALFRRIEASGKFGDRITADGIRKRIIKRRLILCGRDASQYSTHSIRAGWITDAAEMGYSNRH